MFFVLVKKIETAMAIVFTYGSLMCADIMAAITGVDLHSDVVVISNFARYALRGQTFPAMVAEESARVEGRLYYDVDESALARLDVFEGDCYQRCTVSVKTSNGTDLRAQAYVLRDSYRSLLADWDWDFDHFLAHGKKDFTNRYLS
jgi:gamma-glutamylcyclotransferase (GGCT)/AIG2-like uncharacterized protein YtfP